jgi:hypothetical protein
MVAGAALFDANLVTFLTEWTGWEPAEGDTVRWPVYSTLATSLLCLAVAINFREPPRQAPDNRHSLSRAWNNIIEGAVHVFTSRHILFLMLGALLIDSFVRIFLTFASNYYRLIDLPPFVNGILGSAIALLGFAAAPLAKKMVARRSVATNFIATASLAFVGLVGTALAWPIWGAWVLVPLGLAMSLLQFFTSNYLNQWTDSHVRATVLSFRGMTFNLGYALAGLFFAGLTAHLRATHLGADENTIFAMALPWLPSTFLACAILLWITLRLTRPSIAAS